MPFSRDLSPRGLFAEYTAFRSSSNIRICRSAGRFALSNIFVGSLHARAWDSGNQELIGDWNGTIDEEGQPVTAYVAVDIAQVFAPVNVPLSAAPSQNISPFALFTRPPPVDFVLV